MDIPWTLTGLILDGIGALIVVVPEIRGIGPFLTTRIGPVITRSSRYSDLDYIYENLYGEETDYRCDGENIWLEPGRRGFETMAKIVGERLGRQPDKIILVHSDGVPNQTNFDEDFPDNYGATILADWIINEQEKLQNKYSRLIMAIGALLIATGFGFQIVGL